jgi:hypothetical protein
MKTGTWLISGASVAGGVSIMPTLSAWLMVGVGSISMNRLDGALLASVIVFVTVTISVAVPTLVNVVMIVDSTVESSTFVVVIVSVTVVVW